VNEQNDRNDLEGISSCAVPVKWIRPKRRKIIKQGEYSDCIVVKKQFDAENPHATSDGPTRSHLPNICSRLSYTGVQVMPSESNVCAQ